MTQVYVERIGDGNDDDLEDAEAFADDLNYLLAEGFISIEIDEDGSARLYPN